MYKDTITLFCRERRSQGDIWHPTILMNVNVNKDKGSIVKVYGETSQDNVIINVRFFNIDGKRIVAGTKAYVTDGDLDGEYFSPWSMTPSLDGGGFNPWDEYAYYKALQWMPPKEWQRSDKSESITFASGGAFDFIWIGEWSGGEVIYDDNYGDMSFYDYMLANYDYVYAITSVGDFSVIPHFEITGR